MVDLEGQLSPWSTTGDEGAETCELRFPFPGNHPMILEVPLDGPHMEMAHWNLFLCHSKKP